MTIAIFGTGGHAKSIYDIVKRKKIYFFDNSKKKFEISNKTDVRKIPLFFFHEI